VLGLLSVLLGFIGVFLPVLPTTPFLLLAAFCFARSSKRLHLWLTEHKIFGPPIRDWQEKGAISVPAKRLAVGSMIAVFSISLAMGLPIYALVPQGLALLGAGTFILTRPSA
jgi:uncharacterized membrane protein YbaN (DUF454 family)